VIHALLSRKTASTASTDKLAPKVTSRDLRIGEPNAAFDWGTDRAADRVIAGARGSQGLSISKIDVSASLQRKCACGGSAGPTGECEECRKKRLQRKERKPETETRTNSSVPPMVCEVLGSPGKPLDISVRRFAEPRFDYDFSRVRVHTDLHAAESARAVNALAYTVGRDIVFGAGQYQPSTIEGRKLLAHELTHVVQQGNEAQMPSELRVASADDLYEAEANAVVNSIDRPAKALNDQTRESLSHTRGAGRVGTRLQRACLPASDCAGPGSTLTGFVAKTESKPENVAKASKRKAACTKVPPDPSCTSDGHGAIATALTAILNAKYPSRAGYISGIYINKDMPANWGAVTDDCSSFMPPLSGGKCTSVPDTLEAQGKLYQGGAKKIAGKSRQNWLTATIGTLTHETEHARFDTAAPIVEPNPTACKFADLQANLSEMAAHLSEMHVYYRDALARPNKDRFNRFYGVFNFWVENGSEDISGVVKDLRCRCECADADYFITKTVESVATNQKWDSNERFVIHTELRQPKWALKWPVTPPASVDVGDLPSAAAAPLKFE
jgi:Domain of unknown function (DUF4157)